MKNLEIVSVDTTTQLKSEIKGHQVNYIHVSKNGEAPKVISFSVPGANGLLGNGNMIVASGAFSLTRTDYENFPSEIESEIFNQCKSIALELTK